MRKETKDGYAILHTTVYIYINHFSDLKASQEEATEAAKEGG